MILCQMISLDANTNAAVHDERDEAEIDDGVEEESVRGDGSAAKRSCQHASSEASGMSAQHGRRPHDDAGVEEPV